MLLNSHIASETYCIQNLHVYLFVFLVLRIKVFLLQIGKLQTTFHRWEQVAANTGEYVHLTKELLTSCESIEWQV